MSLYEKICYAREKSIIIDPSKKSRDEKMKILSQLMNIAFNNEQTPDELPKLFRLEGLEIMDYHIIEWFLIHCVNLMVHSVTLVNSDEVKGNTFEIKLF